MITKEEIEAEGWISQRENRFIKVDGYYDKTDDSTGVEYLLTVSPKSERMWIEKGEISFGKAYYPYEGSNYIFQGKCSSIEDFYTILRLLAI
jgi:hypothetical protein